MPQSRNSSNRSNEHPSSPSSSLPLDHKCRRCSNLLIHDNDDHGTATWRCSGCSRLYYEKITKEATNRQKSTTPPYTKPPLLPQVPAGRKLSTYLNNAPKALIQRYERGSRGVDNRPPGPPFSVQSLLRELLCNPMMQKAWNTINKSVQSEDDYGNLFKAIIESIRVARLGIVSQTEKRGKYEDIAKCAEKLARLIAEPQRLPRDGSPPLYRGDLDLQAYELLPQDVASFLGAQGWATMKRDERSDWAYSLLPEWPTMVELLNQLAFRARQCGREKMSSVERDRGLARVVIFVRELHRHFHSMNAQFNKFSAIATIASIAFATTDVKGLNGKAVRKMIFGATGNLPIKTKGKSMLNV